jgi:hypothetical protein
VLLLFDANYNIPAGQCFFFKIFCFAGGQNPGAGATHVKKRADLQATCQEENVVGN